MNYMNYMNLFIDFLLKRAQALQNVQKNNHTIKPKYEFIHKQKSFVLQMDTLNCPLCNQPLLLFRCKNYLDLSPEGKLNQVRKFNLCYNCLS